MKFSGTDPFRGILVAILVTICLLNMGKCQDSEDEEEEESEETTSKTSVKSEDEATTLNPLSSIILSGIQKSSNGTPSAAMINILVQQMLKNTKKSEAEDSITIEAEVTNSTNEVSNTTKTKEVQEANEPVNPALMNALLQLAVMNANRQQQQAQATTAAPEPAELAVTEDPDSIEFIMGQVNKIIQSVSSGNISGIIENALRIQAPGTVQVIMTNILNYLNGLTGGIFGLRPSTPRPTGGAALRANEAQCPAVRIPSTTPRGSASATNIG